MLNFLNLTIYIIGAILFCILNQHVLCNHWIIRTLPLNIKSFFDPSEVNRICALLTLKNSEENKLCLTHPNIMSSVIYGAQLGLSECGRQFRYDRWNCSFTSTDLNINMRNLIEMTSRNIKETSFLYAVWTSGVVYSVTNACSRGHLKECYCDPKRHGQDKDHIGDFTWGGCSDHIKFGMKMGRLFLDRYNTRLPRERISMDIHNNRVGRRVVWKTRLKKCKCHGVSGACSLRTCWQRMSDFRRIGQQLKRKYRKAQLVFYSRMNNKLMLESNRYREPGRKKMVYLAKSPDYCVADKSIGHPGTSGRECNFTSLSHDSCSHLCCNRGHYTYEMIVEKNCECKFEWCCDVKCKVCNQKVFIYRCKEDNFLPQNIFS